MFETLFGAEMPLAIRFFLAFLVVLGLIGITAWIVRRFGSGRLTAAGLRGRQPRLGVIEHAHVDARRRLILVRRDNVEHLLLTGGPTDVVVEANIVRAVPATREVTLPRSPAVAEALPRPAPLPETAANGSWPLQPETMGPPRPSPRLETMPAEPARWPAQPHAEPAPRPPRDTLAALADEIGSRPVPLRNRGAGPARPHPVERTESRPEPRMLPVQSVEADASPGPDQNLVEMAHRLEAALRKPKNAPAGREARAPTVRAAPPPVPPPEDAAEPEAAPAPPTPPQRATRGGEGRAGRTGQGKALYESLEQEMASLLGRPAGKT